MPESISYSIIMPVYNGRNYFPEALTSAISAITSDDEIIVVEDGSTDGGVAEFIPQQPNIRYFRKENGGVASALNEGLSKAAKKYFCWLSHDDIYLPDRLSSDRRLRIYAPNVITASSFYLLYQDTGTIRGVNIEKFQRSNYRLALLSKRFLNGNCLTAPIESIKQCGMFDEQLKHTQDYDLWMTLSMTHDFLFLGEKTVISRQHANQDSVTGHKVAKKEWWNICKKHKGELIIKRPKDIYYLLNLLYMLLRP